MAGFTSLPVISVSSLDNCTLHALFHNDILCSECQQSICLVCYSTSHKDHSIEAKLCVREEPKHETKEEKETKKRRIEHMQENLNNRRKRIKSMKRQCEELGHVVEETAAEREMFLDRQRDELELDKRDCKRRIKRYTERLEQEEDDIYALQRSTENAMSSSECCDEIETLESKVESHATVGLPREQSLLELEATVQRFKSASWSTYHSSRSSSTSGMSEEFIVFTASQTSRCESLPTEPTSLPEPMEMEGGGQNPGTSPAVSILDQMQGIRERALDESDGGANPKEEEEDVRGASQSLRKDSGEDMQVDSRITPGGTTNEEKDKDIPELLLHQLAEKIISSKIVPLGLSLELKYSEIDHIKCNNPKNIVQAIFEVLLKWKRRLSRDVPVIYHYEKLAAVLKKIDQSEEADWLIQSTLTK